MKQNIILPIVSLVVLGLVGTIIALAGFNAINQGTAQQAATIEGLVDKLETQAVSQEKAGGLVEVFRKIHPEGLIIGDDETENIFLTDSSNNLYIGTSTDATFSINASTGRITMRDVNFTTSSTIPIITGNTTFTGTLTVATTTGGRITQGGLVHSTTTGPAGTTTAAVLANSSVLEITPSEASTVYFPSTTTLYSYLDGNGKSFDVSVHNAGDYIVTFAQGWVLGTDLRGTSTDSFNIGPDGWKVFRIQRTSLTTSTIFSLGSFGYGD